MTESSYITVGKPASSEFIINKSRFITCATPVESEDEALTFLEQIRREYRDATHHCYAYTIGRNMGIMRYSDDGEPGGTAGLPMMDVIRKKQVCNCCVVVTRYFGGILLGAGGLVRAYTRGCSDGLQAAGLVLMERSVEYICEISYSLWDRVQHALKQLPVQLVSTEFGAAVTFTLSVRSTDTEPVLTELTRICDGRIEWLEGETSWKAWPVCT